MIIVLLLRCARFDHSIIRSHLAVATTGTTPPLPCISCLSCICDDCVSQHITRASARERLQEG